LQNEHIIYKKISHGGGANFTHVSTVSLEMYVCIIQEGGDTITRA